MYISIYGEKDRNGDPCGIKRNLASTFKDRVKPKQQEPLRKQTSNKTLIKVTIEHRNYYVCLCIYFFNEVLSFGDVVLAKHHHSGQVSSSVPPVACHLATRITQTVHYPSTSKLPQTANIFHIN